jgi:hypothetical protein
LKEKGKNFEVKFEEKARERRKLRERKCKYFFLVERRK